MTRPEGTPVADRDAWTYTAPPRRQAVGRGIRRTVVIGATAVGVLGGSSMITTGDPLELSEGIAYGVGEMITSCDPIDNDLVTDMHDKLTADIAKAARVDPDAAAPTEAVFDDATLPALAQKYGFTLPVDAKTVYNETLTNSWQPWSAVSRVDAYMYENYGIHVKDENPTEETIEQAADLVARFYPIPPELVRKTSEEDVQTIVLDARIDNVMAVANYSPVEEAIRLRPEHTGSVVHELNHGILVTSSRENCSFLTNNEQKNYDAVNPPGFTYGVDNPDWHKVTPTEYAAEKADGPSEDYADIGALIMGSPFGDITRCAASLPITVKDKIAINLASYDQLAPGSGAYFSEQLAARSKC